jgi:hypothetical protein
MQKTARLALSPWELMRQALGSAEVRRGKLARLGRVLASYGRGSELAARLGRLRERGIIEEVPDPLQLVVGSIDMLRFWISPAAADYYERRGIG